MSNQTIIERAMLKQYCENEKIHEAFRNSKPSEVIEKRLMNAYCEKQAAEKAARGIKPSAKDIENKAANDRLELSFRASVY